MNESSNSGNEPTIVPNIPLGPHRVPAIDCGKCGHEHHIDCATGEYQGHCSVCYAFLRRPTDAEQDKFYHFMAWNGAHLEREWNRVAAL